MVIAVDEIALDETALEDTTLDDTALDEIKLDDTLLSNILIPSKPEAPKYLKFQFCLNTTYDSDINNYHTVI
jgi:hypothetical protein